MYRLNGRIWLWGALGILLVAILGSVLLYRGIEDLDSEFRNQNPIRESGVDRAMTLLENMYPTLKSDYIQKLFRKADMSAAVLSSQITEDGFTGQRLFSNAMVLELEGDHFLYPEGADNLGKLFPVSYTSNIKGIFPSSDIPDLKEDPNCHFLMEMISPRYYYISWIPYSDWDQYVQTCLDEGNVLNGIFQASGGQMIMLDGMKVSDALIVAPTEYADYNSAEEMGFTQEMLDAKEGSIVIQGVEYRYVSGDIHGSQKKCIFITPTETVFMRSLYAALAVCATCLLFVLGIIIYNCSVREIVKKYKLTEQQKKMYCPERVRKVNLSVWVFGMLFVLLTAVSIRLVGRIYIKAREDQSILNILSEQLDVAENRKMKLAEIEKKWYLYYCTSLAEILAGHPESMTKEVLEDISGKLGTQYIMLFDEKGNQIASSADYRGFSLGTTAEDSTYDFRRLLLGVDPIVHEPCRDERTGLISVQFGAPLSLGSDRGYGACILAMDTDRFISEIDFRETDKLLKSLQSPEKAFIGINQETGIVQYTTDKSILEEKDDAELSGIPKDKIRGGIIDYLKIGNNRFLVSSAEREGTVFFYLTRHLLSGTNLSGYLIISTVGFAAVFFLMVLISLFGYTHKWFDEWAEKGTEYIDGRMTEIILARGKRKKSIDPFKRWTLLPETWNMMLPGQKTKLVIECLFAVILFIFLFAVHIDEAVPGEDIVRFFLEGDWTRGLNSFSVVGIVTITLMAALFMLLLKVVFSLLCVAFGTKGETICRLLYNLSEYVMVIVVLYHAFTFLGYDTRALLASVGIVSLAVSLGSRELITDILAGITIVFEGEFQVGDIVDVGGYRGVVEEIGIRTTKLEGRGGNIRVIRNQDVRNVINMTRRNSWYPVDITISTKQPLQKVEELFERELPDIGKRVGAIISGPFYKGVVSFGGGKMTLSVIAECSESNYHYVQRSLNREIYILLTENGIEL